MSTREELDPEGLGADVHVATTPLGRIYGALWAFMCSLPRAMTLLMVLGVACFVGMFFDQTLTYEQHAAQWGSEAAWKLAVFTFLEMNDVFGSWWFVIIIAYLLISITACSVERFPKIWIDTLNPRKHLADDQLRGIKQVYRATVTTAQAQKASSLVKAIFGRGAEEQQKDGTTFFFLERQRFARFGVYIIHTGLLLIFSGGILVNFTKIDGMMMISEGRNAHLVRVWGPGRLPYTVDLGFEVRCDDFRLKTFIDGAPMEFESDLSVWDKDSPVNPVLRKTIQVNDPLEYKGYTFYQASYNPIPGDQRVKLDIGPRGGQRLTYDLAIGEKAVLADGTEFLATETIPEFAGLGAAVRVQQVSTRADGSKVTTSFVVFRSYPAFDRDVRRGDYEVQFHGFDQTYATGIQVGQVPFIPIVFIGFVVMFVGMFMAFFMSHRRYWARLVPVEGSPDKLEFIVAGAARRHQYAFDEEFAKIRDILETAFGKAESTADRARALKAARKAAASTSSATTPSKKSESEKTEKPSETPPKEST